MPNTIKIKNSGATTTSPISLLSGEIAINYADGKLFYKDSTNTIVGSKLVKDILGTANQISVSETNGTFTLSFPNSININNNITAGGTASLGTLLVGNVEIRTTRSHY